MLDVLRVNDAIHSWNSCRFLIDVQPFTGLVEVNVKEKRDRKLVKGARRDGVPLGMTSGSYEVESMTGKFLTDQWDLITDYLSAKGLGSYGDASFTFSIEQAEEADIEVPVMILLVNGCRVISVENSFAEGVEENVVSVEFKAMTAFGNGKVLFSLARSIL